MTEIAHLQPRAWLLVDPGLDDEPIHDDFFESREQAEQYREQLTQELMLDPPKRLFPAVRLVTPEGEAEMARKIREWAEGLTRDLKIVDAYL